MAVPTVLLYNLDTDKGRQIKLLCLTMKLRARSVSPAEYSLTLSDLLSGKAVEGQAAEKTFPEEMLVMANLTSAQTDRFLQSLRRNRKKISPVALKAVLTATNAGWDSFQLRDELQREHEAMAAGKTAHSG